MQDDECNAQTSRVCVQSSDVYLMYECGVVPQYAVQNACPNSFFIGMLIRPHDDQKGARRDADIAWTFSRTG